MKLVSKDSKLHKALIRYRYHYLNKKLDNLSESSTRLIINHLLCDVLGYRELVDIKVEYPVQGGFIDYLIQLGNKKLFVIEAKSIDTKITNKHLRQAVYYAVTVGSNWVILTNARALDLYKIQFTKPVKITKVFSIDLKRLDKRTKYLLSTLTKQSVSRKGLNMLKTVE